MPANKPNILVIWGDDIGWFNVSAYNMGVMGYRTSNIDGSARKAPFLLTGMASRAAPLAASFHHRTDAGSHRPHQGRSAWCRTWSQAA